MAEPDQSIIDKFTSANSGTRIEMIGTMTHELLIDSTIYSQITDEDVWIVYLRRVGNIEIATLNEKALSIIVKLLKCEYVDLHRYALSCVAITQWQDPDAITTLINAIYARLETTQYYFYIRDCIKILAVTRPNLIIEYFNSNPDQNTTISEAINTLLQATQDYYYINDFIELLCVVNPDSVLEYLNKNPQSFEGLKQYKSYSANIWSAYSHVQSSQLRKEFITQIVKIGWSAQSFPDEFILGELVKMGVD